MADLIIKPSNGNSLVFQDEGGDPALTVGTTGNTTLAGTANNLGTVTAGSIAGGAITSATTFPAGHIIKQEIIKVTNTGVHANFVAEADMESPMDGSQYFTPLQTTTNFIANMNFNLIAQSDTWSSEIIKAYYKIGSGGSWFFYGMSWMTRYVNGHWTSSQHTAQYTTIQRNPSGFAMGSETKIYLKFTIEGDASGRNWAPNSYEIESASTHTFLSSTDIGNAGSFILIQEVKV